MSFDVIKGTVVLWGLGSLLIFIAGLALGRWWARGRWWALGRLWARRRQPKVGNPSVNALQMIQQMSRLAAVMSGDFSQHQKLMRSVSEEVEKLGGTVDAEALREMLGRLNAANRNLNLKLSEMQRDLDAKAAEVKSLVCESRTDALTGLPNRRSFNESIQHRIGEIRRYGGELSFVILDVDHFKNFNDTYGHLLGDDVLREVADVLSRTVRDADIATRMGGEEFGVIMPSVGLHEAGQAAERLRQAIEQCSVQYEGQRLQVTASFGVTEVHPADHPEQVIDRADQALYAAKQAQRNAVWLWDEKRLRPLLEPPRSGLAVPAEMQEPCLSLRRRLIESIEGS